MAETFKSAMRDVAGRELDAMIAERVMGATWKPAPEDGRGKEVDWLYLGGRIVAYRYADGQVLGKADDYSTDLAAAFTVIEAMAAKPERWWSTLTQRSYGTTKENYVVGGWSCEFRAIEAIGAGDVYAEAPTLPLAICLAALKAIEGSSSVPDSEEG